jgi:hypothetical protein
MAQAVQRHSNAIGKFGIEPRPRSAAILYEGDYVASESRSRLPGTEKFDAARPAAADHWSLLCSSIWRRHPGLKRPRIYLTFLLISDCRAT